MSDVDDVLERLVTDPVFAAALGHDPAMALAGYDLTEGDLDLLSAQLTADIGTNSGVEQRISKAGLAGLMSLGHDIHGGSSSIGNPDFHPQLDVHGGGGPATVGNPDLHVGSIGNPNLMPNMPVEIPPAPPD